MAHPVAQTFKDCAELIVADKNRKGNWLYFDKDDYIIFTGDIHGHLQNLTRIINHADLGKDPRRKLILHEIIHADTSSEEGIDRSVEALLRAARLKISHPQQVFFLIANHDIAQITGNEILKRDVGVCKMFNQSLDAIFGPAANEVREAILNMLRNQPLAARCPNGAFMAHSVPDPDKLDTIDWDIFNRPYKQEDFHRNGTVYSWTWGHVHDEEQLERISKQLDVKLFFLGHRLIQTGYEIHHQRAVILASNHSHGAVVEFAADEPLNSETIKDCIRSIISL